jgi:hypothetical protein
MVAGLSLVLLVVVAYLARGRGVLGGCCLIACGLLWLATNKPMEGPTLLHVTHDHGLTIGDVAGLAALVLGAVQIWRSPARLSRDTDR